MKKRLIIVIVAVVLAVLNCFMNLGLFWLTDEIDMRYWREHNILLDLFTMSPILIMPILPIVTSVISGRILQKRYVVNEEQRNLFLVISDGIYLVLLFTVFQMCCAIWEIGAEWGRGIFLAVTWFVSLGVSASWFLIVVCVWIGELRRKKKEDVH
ncbi:MAG: hypothetical protein E7292_00705 [Lachnospiraceae bacterium]|nr:hypothetical protein [Lachnospiraceae bacterium]